jgi:AcrR family transcriptional regulator
MQTTARPGSSAEETRARILAAAKAIYEQNGTRGTTTREVAERAGVNEATLFRHFGNKHALLVAMRESACPLAVFESVLATLSGDLAGNLRTIAGSMIEFMHARRALMCISLAEDAQGDIQEDTGSVPEWRGPMEIMRRLESFFAEQIGQGEIRGDAHRLAAYFMGMCFSYVIARKIWDSYSIKEADLDCLVDIFLNGVK